MHQVYRALEVLAKENRPHPIIQMGLFPDGDGMPLAFPLFPGAMNEQGSLKPLEKQVLRDFELSKSIVCTDAGLASMDNRKFNDKPGRASAVTQSLKKMKRHLKDWTLDPKGYVPLYTRDELTEALHEQFGFHTDHEMVTLSAMRKIISQTKKQSHMTHFLS